MTLRSAPLSWKGFGYRRKGDLRPSGQCSRSTPTSPRRQSVFTLKFPSQLRLRKNGVRVVGPYIERSFATGIAAAGDDEQNQHQTEAYSAG